MDQSLAEDRRDPLVLVPGSPCLSRAPGAWKRSRTPSGARNMGRAAAAGGGAGGARVWLPWLGLCFWAAGAAAARGKRRAERAAGPGERRGGDGETGWDAHPWRWLPKLRAAPLRARTPQGGNRAEDLGGDHCLPPQVCYQPQSYRLL